MFQGKGEQFRRERTTLTSGVNGVIAIAQNKYEMTSKQICMCKSCIHKHAFILAYMYLSLMIMSCISLTESFDSQYFNCIIPDDVPGEGTHEEDLEPDSVEH